MLTIIDQTFLVYSIDEGLDECSRFQVPGSQRGINLGGNKWDSRGAGRATTRRRIERRVWNNCQSFSAAI
jgi:hypothetical protein